MPELFWWDLPPLQRDQMLADRISILEQQFANLPGRSEELIQNPAGTLSSSGVFTGGASSTTNLNSGNVILAGLTATPNTPAITAGAPIFTPTFDVWLLDGWISVVTLWGGAAAFADIGTTSTTKGLFQFCMQQGLANPVGVSVQAGNQEWVPDVSLFAFQMHNNAGATLRNAAMYLAATTAGALSPSPVQAPGPAFPSNLTYTPTNFQPGVPMLVKTGTSITVWVTSNGQPNGPDPGAGGVGEIRAYVLLGKSLSSGSDQG